MYDDGIYVNVMQLLDEAQDRLGLFLIYDGVDGDVYSRLVKMSIGREAGYVFDAVAGRSSCAERLSADVYGISSVLDGFYANVRCLGWGEEFYASH